MKLKRIIFIFLSMCCLVGCSNASTGETEIQEQTQQTEQVGETSHEEWITDEEQFEIWSEDVLYSQTLEDPLLEDFSLAEFVKCDERYPAIYDDEYKIIFYDYHIEIQKYDSEYTFEIQLPWYLTSGYIFCGRVSVDRCDMDGDGIEDLIFTTWHTGIGHMQFVDVLDLTNMKLCKFDYEPEELVENVTNFNTEEFDYNYDETDFRWYEDGVIYAEIYFGHNMTPFGTGDCEILGTISGKLVYQPETFSFVLDKDSIEVKWNE